MQRGKTFGGMGNGSQYNVSAAEEAAGSQAGLVAFGKRPFHAVGGPTTEKDKLLSLLASNRQPVASLQKAESAPSQQQQDAVPDTTAREAYEVWKEAMKQRKRAKLDR